MKKVSFLFLSVLAAVSISAQEVIEGSSTEPGRKATFVDNGFWDNWFIGAGAGANVYFDDYGVKADGLGDRITVMPNVQFGKWINPWLGLRVKATGFLDLKTFNNDVNKDGKVTGSKQKYVGAEANLMWNMTDYLLPYKANRVYKFIPYAGLGYARGWDYRDYRGTYNGTDTQNSLTFDVGIINRFRLANNINLDIELSGKALKDRFDNRSGGKRGYDAMATASASLIFDIGSKATNFSEAVLRDQYEIDNLNRKINEQRAEIDALQRRPAPVAPSEPEVIVKEVKVYDKSCEPVNNVVLFPISGTKVQSHQEVNIYNVVKYLRENPESKVRVVGYTDKATGTAAINERLSRERAQAVTNVMINKYNISKDRIIVNWEGQTNPPFDVVEWNRAVILYIE